MGHFKDIFKNKFIDLLLINMENIFIEKIKEMEDALALMERMSSIIYKSNYSENVKQSCSDLKSDMYEEREKKKKELEKFMKKKYKPIHFKKHGNDPF